MKVKLPTAIVPARGGLPTAFGATVKVTLPFPAPFGAPVIAIHGALGCAVHAQAAPVVTEKLDGPPAAGNDWTFPLSE